jgi:hypothetical protein
MLQYIKHVEEINLQSFHRYKAGFQFSGNINQLSPHDQFDLWCTVATWALLAVLLTRHHPKNRKRSLK